MLINATVMSADYAHPLFASNPGRRDMHNHIMHCVASFTTPLTQATLLESTPRGRRIMVIPKLPKLVPWVRFQSTAPLCPYPLTSRTLARIRRIVCNGPSRRSSCVSYAFTASKI